MKEVGLEAAERLLADRTFRTLVEDVKGVRTEVVKRWPLRRGGQIVNDVGCSISSARNPRRILAHILQGAETAMLRAIVGELGDEILVLQHDGWSMRRKLDVPEQQRMEQRVYELTGYRIAIAKKRLKNPIGSLEPSGQNECIDVGQPNQPLGHPETVASAT
ncbi:MAG: hypothetical protein WCB10_11215 [Steroidobacteraceae bacterium]